MANVYFGLILENGTSFQALDQAEYVVELGEILWVYVNAHSLRRRSYLSNGKCPTDKTPNDT